jgi:hypothetical protein
LLFSVETNWKNIWQEFFKIETDQQKTTIDDLIDLEVKAPEQELYTDYLLKFNFYNLGISFTADYNYYSNSISQEEYETDLQNYALGIKWSLLKNGMYSNWQRTRQLEQKLKFNKFFNRETASNQYQFNYNKIIEFFSRQKFLFLHHSLKFQNRYYELLRNSYFLTKQDPDKVLELKRSVTRISNQLQNYEEYSLTDVFASDYFELPVFDLDIETIRSDLQDRTETELLPDFTETNLDKTFWQEIGLSIFGKRQFYLGEDRNDRYLAGIDLSIPFSAFDSGNRYEYEDRKNDLFRRMEFIDLKLMNLYYEFKYKLDDVIKLSFNYALAKDKLHREYIENLYLNNEEDPFRKFQLLKNIYDIKFELLEVKERYYLAYLKILDATELPDLEKYKRATEIADPQLFRLREGNRSLYVWSESFNEHDLTYFNSLSYVKNISEHIISLSQKTDRDKLSDLIKVNQAMGRETSLLLSNNQFLFPEKRDDLSEILNEISKFEINSLHLDIEPQQLPNWREEKYDSLLVDLLYYVRASYTGKLAVSIPVIFSSDINQAVYEIADEIYLMAYNRNKLRDDLPEFLSAEQKTKTVLAINAKDFLNELELEEFIIQMQEEFSLSHFAIHDMKNYIKLVSNYEIKKKN